MRAPTTGEFRSSVLVRSIVVVFLGLFLTTAHAVAPGTDAEIEARLIPNGSVCKVGDDCGTVSAAAQASSGAAMSGEQVYNQFCFACHSAGVAGAPKFGSKADWEPHIAKGIDTLVQSAINGVPPGMPAKGTCMSCSDDELHAAVEYMVEHATE